MSDHDPTDPICPASEVPGNGCLCAWLKAARADEREKIARAIEERLNQMHSDWRNPRYEEAIRIARSGGNDGPA